MEDDRIRGLVCVPIHGRDRILGTLTLGRRTEDPFTDREVAAATNRLTLIAAILVYEMWRQHGFSGAV